MTDLEKLRAAHDAAVARAEAAEANLYTAAQINATDTIVADLRAMSALYSTGLPSALATRYEAGDHLAAQEQETPNE
jgi:hypothetical protein